MGKAAHIAYIEELKIVGAALRRFVETDAQVETAVYPSRTLPPEPRALTEKSISQLSSSSRSLSQHVDATTNMSPSPSTPVSIKYQSHHMKFRETPPWDYFGLFHPIDNHLSSQEGREFDQGSENSDETRHLRVEEGVPEMEDVEDKFSSHGIEESQVSEDEFDEPSSATLVRSFKNVNRENVANGDSPLISSEHRTSETKFAKFENVTEEKENLIGGDSPIRSSESVISETKFVNGKKNNSPDLSPLRTASSRFVQLNDVKITPIKQSEVEDKVVPKDFFSSMKDIEQLFVKASESGKEVPRMLEANKFHFRPVVPGERSSVEIEGNGLGNVKCLQVAQQSTWNSHAIDVPTPLMVSTILVIISSTTSAWSLEAMPQPWIGLYAWEKKLYDEVKAGQVLRSNFDQKCKLLRQQESRGENTDKTRAGVKDLHSRIKVAIHRINSISKKIEEIRDKELQPQLEELIEGLRKMWENMLECHSLQFHIISVSHTPGGTKITIQTDARRQITIHLENELSSLLSTFTKWIGAQKLYVETIDKWLFKCVSLPQTTSKRNKRMKPPPLRNWGPPIYMICGAWLEMIDELPTKGVTDSIKDLAAEVAHFLPRQEKNHGKAGNQSTTGRP
ncbi:UNVERIFIED_CONTAM: protein ALTERED PHOSPHATE STARVATION RESPONSE 1 [Sesamum calycinum]|uniref:Protein ALTERED PHOSPHATE STARVATION RESPONSE 1 n=1 Tax=Sesamum calycinum TaxID=2727403 RepID=A0AAW2J4Z6_9LAMI